MEVIVDAFREEGAHCGGRCEHTAELVSDDRH